MGVGWRGKVIYRLRMFAETKEYQIRVDVTTDCCSIDSERDIQQGNNSNPIVVRARQSSRWKYTRMLSHQDISSHELKWKRVASSSCLNL